jgi:hypothetical protein
MRLPHPLRPRLIRLAPIPPPGFDGSPHADQCDLRSNSRCQQGGLTLAHAEMSA